MAWTGYPVCPDEESSSWSQNIYLVAYITLAAHRLLRWLRNAHLQKLVASHLSPRVACAGSCTGHQVSQHEQNPTRRLTTRERTVQNSKKSHGARAGRCSVMSV